MVVYRDRSYSNLPAPHNNDGVTPRPLLAPLRPTVTLHYPGSPVGVSYAGDTMRGDVKKKAYISAVQRNAVAQGKSYEYNYFIFTDGEIWEYAGDYLAAHSAGENTVSYGVQFVNGQDDLCTDAQVAAFHWLRDIHLAARGRITGDCACTPHRDMPSASTACPGDRAIMPRLPALRAPSVVTPPSTVGASVQFIVKGTTGTAVYVTDWLTKRHIDGPTYNTLVLLAQDPANGIRVSAAGGFIELADVVVDGIPFGHSGGGPDGPPADVIADEVAAELARRLVA
jgi:hypothetical protein